MRLALALLLLIAPAAVGQCRLDRCSDDPLGVLGNERIEWTASEGATYYILGVEDGSGQGSGIASCASTNALAKDLAGTTCYGDRIYVKACAADDVCSEWSWSQSIEVLPYACVRGHTQHVGLLPRDNWTDSCETPCWVGAPRRLPSIPECQ